MDTDAAFCDRQLPSELEEKVLSFLPVPDLCRYRSVCKEWNQLICSPAFATLQAQNGKRRGASFIAMEMQGLETLTWCFLDLNTRRWYTFRDVDSNNIIVRHCHPYLGSGVAAMDGGLVCRFAKTKHPMLSMIVHDLLGHTVKSLPLTRRHLTSLEPPLVHMVVDSTSHHFTIFLLNRDFNLSIFAKKVETTSEVGQEILNDPLMRIYYSARGEWRSASNPLWIMEPFWFSFDFVSIVMCQGLVYALMEADATFFMAEIGDQWFAICYNPMEDAWERTPFCLSNKDAEDPQLIVINNRLFVALWRFNSKALHTYDFEVSEIIIPHMTLETLFKLPMPDLMDLLEVKMKNFDLRNGNCCFPDYLGMNVNGVDNGVFVQSWLSGKAKVFDLDTRSWDHGIPEHPLGHLFSGKGPSKIAKQTNLLLPNSVQYLI